MNKEIDIEYFKNHIANDNHLVVDLRNSDERNEIPIDFSDDVFLFEKENIPYSEVEVPYFFRTLSLVFVCSDGEFSKSILDRFPTMDNLLYIKNGHKGLKK